MWYAGLGCNVKRFNKLNDSKFKELVVEDVIKFENKMFKFYIFT